MRSEVLMGRPKKGKKPTALAGRSIGVRATHEWADWIQRYADHCRTDVAKLIEACLILSMEHYKFEEKPPRRVP